MDDMMMIAEFEELIDLHGPDADLWPAADRPRAMALLARSSAAQAVMAQARLMEQALTAMPLDQASAELRRAILAIPAASGEARSSKQRPADQRLPAGGGGWRSGRTPILAGGGRGTWGGLWGGSISAALASGLAAAALGVVLGVHGVSPIALSSTDATATTEYMKAMTEIDTEIGQ
ncbi:hypothetical protein [Nitrospirillum sp. BR 11828]|uniref:hypothetical protein n=1 Tax=Nitrospirillum sp. BR 11828 TaxID=3104325 RepID=UPI002ACA9750|nr:hypothetical protein [Nitrospirillum sp. BR 11828]MDZ5648933.1 hypothetical protein [Nitrospirillum sp. BR 11828]